MALSAIIVERGGELDGGVQHVGPRTVARLTKQLRTVSVSHLYHMTGTVSGPGEESFRRISESTGTAGGTLLLIESTVVMDPGILEDIARAPEPETPVVVTRPLESAFSAVGGIDRWNPVSFGEDAGSRHGPKQLPMGVYLLPGREFPRLISHIDLATNPSVADDIESFLLKECVRVLSIVSRNSEVARRPLSGPSVREQLPRLLEIGEKLVTKRATNGRQKLRAEVQWLRQLPERARPFFSEVLDADLEGDVFSYMMPRYPMRNLEEAVFAGDINPGALRAILPSLFSALAETLYASHAADPAAGYIRFRYLEKLRGRTAAASKLSRLFEQYASAPLLKINGKDVPGLPRMLCAMEEDIPYLAMMEPPRVFPVHGDLKPDNILLANSGSEFRLIDPMGLGLEDTALDGAKPLSTFCGYHYAYKNGRMQVHVEEPGGVPHIRTAFTRGGTLDESIAAACEEATRCIAELPFFSADALWLSRVKLHSALIQLAFASYHLIATEGKHDMTALGLLARGLEMLQEVYPPERLDVRRGRFCNYRFPADRSLAEQMLNE